MKTQKRNNNIKRNNFTRKNYCNVNIRAALIPHAGITYSGDARKSAFNNLNPNTKYIIYLGTVHNLQPSDNIYLLYKSNKSKNTFNLPNKLKKQIVDAPKDINGEIIEHSYKWVHNEIKKKI